MISPCQLRMARAALHVPLRTLAASLGLSAMALSRYEHGDCAVISVATVLDIEAFFVAEGIFFGPKNGVCVGTNVFQSERWLGLACYQMLKDAGISPNSRQLLDAYDRSVSQDASPPPHRRRHAQTGGCGWGTTPQGAGG